MAITFDASSTCWYLARQLPDIDIWAFTNSHPICHELGKRERIQLISYGVVRLSVNIVVTSTLR